MRSNDDRHLKPYAEPVLLSELREDTVYFAVNFVDEAMLIPTVEPVVFVGRNLSPEDEQTVYFQDAESFGRGVRYHSATDRDHAVFFQGSEDEINHIFTYARTLDVLWACADRRKKKLHEDD